MTEEYDRIMYDENLSYTQAAGDLSILTGRLHSRAQVAGKRYRKRVRDGVTPKYARAESLTKRAIRQRKERERQAKAIARTKTAKAVLGLTTRQCRWPEGDAKIALGFCPARHLPGSSYCELHKSLSRQDPKLVNTKKRWNPFWSARRVA